MKLKNQMTRQKRGDFSNAAKKVVVRKKLSDGTEAVWGPQTNHNTNYTVTCAGTSRLQEGSGNMVYVS